MLRHATETPAWQTKSHACRFGLRTKDEPAEMIRTLDLFAGAGGLTLGFQLADLGFEPVLAIEIDQAAASTFKVNFGCDVIDAPIQTVDRFPDAEVILGGPPCQGFSPLGRDRDDASRSLMNEPVAGVRQGRPAGDAGGLRNRERS